MEKKKHIVLNFPIKRVLPIFRYSTVLTLELQLHRKQFSGGSHEFCDIKTVITLIEAYVPLSSVRVRLPSVP